ncbi:MAG TPA: GNAT family N-acetyltransferase [Actinomycetota bacterium]|nr:GNAT family N-acetyltransferase [Actinomycetota bacterium]
MTRAVVVTDEGAARRYAAGWDALAVAASNPYCSPAWMLAWWRRVAPARCDLRVVVALDGDEVVGVAPLFADRRLRGATRLRILGAGTSARVDLVAGAGREDDVARALAPALARTRPQPHAIVLEGIPATSPWPSLLAARWPGPARVRVEYSKASPVMRIDGSFDAWFAAHSRNFRKKLGLRRRRLAERGARYVMARDAGGARRALDAFVALHAARWAPHGGSYVMRPGVEEMLRDVAHELVPSGRMRLWTTEVGDDVVSSQVFVAAGEELSWWLGGYDAAWAEMQPSLVTLLAALEHAFDAGDRRLDFGTGDQAFKYRFADGDVTLDWAVVTTSRRHDPLVRLPFLWRRARLAVGRRVPRAVIRRARSFAGSRR